jgi:hypothetical protein
MNRVLLLAIFLSGCSPMKGLSDAQMAESYACGFTAGQRQIMTIVHMKGQEPESIECQKIHAIAVQNGWGDP